MSYEFGWTTVPTADWENALSAVAAFAVFRCEVAKILVERLSGPTFTLEQILRAQIELTEALTVATTSRMVQSGLPPKRRHLRSVD